MDRADSTDWLRKNVLYPAILNLNLNLDLDLDLYLSLFVFQFRREHGHRLAAEYDARLVDLDVNDAAAR